jgi:hypothetical protein
MNWMTVIFRNRILQIFIPVSASFHVWRMLNADADLARSIPQTIFFGAWYLLGYAFLFFLLNGILAAVNAMIGKQRGIVGEHVLEITDPGLIEKTEYNDTLHKWPSIRRTVSVAGYLFIYVSESNSHQIPKRCFSREELASFVAELKLRSSRAGD